MTALFRYSVLFLVFVTCSCALAQQQNSLLTIKSDSANIITESLAIDIHIIGNTATTTVSMTFYNPLDRILEGELNFPLGEGQQVFRFAMDVNGKLREGSMVDKDKGRKTFERIVRQGIDPGLLEMTTGNNYKCRVYPIPASGRKSIVLAYEEELASMKTVYHLAMKYGEVKNFSLNIRVDNPNAPPKIIDNELSNFQFSKWTNAYIASHTSHDFCACRVLSIALPLEKQELIYHEPITKDSAYFSLIVFPAILRDIKRKPERIALFWDVSGSGAGKDLKKELALLESYFTYLRSATVTLVTFSNTVHSTKAFHISNGDWNALKETLSETIFDGGTQGASINFQSISADEALLFTDGMFNFGKSLSSLSKYPVYVINTNSVADHLKLRTVSEQSGGAYINLNSRSVAEGVDALKANAFRFISASYESNITQVFPAAPADVTGSFSLSGKINGQGVITLNFGSGGKITYRKAISLGGSSVTTAGLGRIWARKKIEHLSRYGDTSRSQIVALATAHNIVTPYTSLIVLDRIEDYVQYEIEPPAEMLKEYRKLIVEKTKRPTHDDDEIIDLAIGDFKEHIAWWKKAFTISRPKDSKVVQRGATRRNVIPEGTVTIVGNEKHVVGYILDGNGDPIPGANVLIKGTNRGTTTDGNGQYSITMPPDGVLVVSFIGYNSYEINPAPGRANIQLTEDVSSLSEVVVVGYANAASVSYSMEKKVEGVAVEGPAYDASSAPASVVGAKPLYVIDGVVSTPEEAAKLEGQVANVAALRSSDASSMYGSRAGDGVIVITTHSAAERGVTLPDTIASRLVSITLEEWDPRAPYLDSLRSAPEHRRYDVYLYFKRKNFNTPSFYLATGSFFIEQGDTKNGIRILSNIAELKIEDHELLKILAYKLTQIGENNAAIGLLETVMKLRSNEPQSYRDLALAYANDGQYQRALNLYLALLKMDGASLDWDDRFPLVKNVAIDELNHLIEKQKNKLDLAQVPAELRIPAPVDLRIIVDWTSLDTDIDLWITQPDGEQCNYKNPLTRAGGKLMKDFTAGHGPEVYMIKKAIPGKYEISIDFYDDRQQKIAGPAFVQLTIIKYYGTSREEKKQTIVQLEDENTKQLKVGEVEF